MARSFDYPPSAYSHQNHGGHTPNLNAVEEYQQSSQPQASCSSSRPARSPQDVRDVAVASSPPARKGRFDPIDDALRSQGYPGRTYVAPNTPTSHAEVLPNPSSGAPGQISQWHPHSENGIETTEQNDTSCSGPAETPVQHDALPTNSDTSDHEGIAPGNPTPRPLDRIQDNLRYYPEYFPARYETVPRDANPPDDPLRYYPAYDQHARRIGLEHVRHPEARPPAGAGSYYRARTYCYPTTDDFPHVRVGDADLRADPSALADAPSSQPGSVSSFRVTKRPARASRRTHKDQDGRPDEVTGDTATAYAQRREQRVQKSSRRDPQ